MPSPKISCQTKAGPVQVPDVRVPEAKSRRIENAPLPYETLYWKVRSPAPESVAVAGQGTCVPSGWGDETAGVKEPMLTVAWSDEAHSTATARRRRFG